MAGQSLLIAGTDTGVGKTLLTAVIASYYQRYYPERRVAVYKPIQSGTGDREYYQQVLHLAQSLEDITPIFLSAPLAPPIAAEKEKRQIDLGCIWHKYQQLLGEYDLVLVETLGGLGSPITYDYLVADLVRDWQIPTLLVGVVRLGGIAQIVANVALARSLGVLLKGIVLNCLTPESREYLSDLTPPDLIESLVNLPVWGVLPPIADTSSSLALSEAARALHLPLQKLWSHGL